MRSLSNDGLMGTDFGPLVLWATNVVLESKKNVLSL